MTEKVGNVSDDERDADELVAQVADLNVDKSGGTRKPHKPLLLLYALSRLLRDGKAVIPFDEVNSALLPLLATYAPPVSAQHHPEYPYWYLRSDGLWEIPGVESLARGARGFPLMESLRSSTGRMPERFVRAIQRSSEVAGRLVRLILDEHFEPSMHDDVLAAVGLERELLGRRSPELRA